jgi:type I restriction enzyme, S subunit
MTTSQKMVYLADVCRIEAGAGFPLVYQGKTDQKYPFYKVGDMNSLGNEKEMHVFQHSISEETRKKLRAIAFPAGTIVFPKIGAAIATNKKRILVEPSCVDNNVMALTPGEKLFSDFLLYLFLNKDLIDFANTGNPPSIRQSTIEEWRIPLPPLAEQKRIADLLARADSLRRLRRYARQLSDTYLQSVFVELFGDPTRNPKGWNIATLEDLNTEFIYGTSQKCFTESKGYPVLRIPNILHNQIDLGDLKYAEVPKKEAKNILLKQGDILFVRTNGNPDYVGRCAVFDLNKDFLFASYLIRARLNLNDINPVFLITYLRSPKGRETMFPYIRTTAGQSNIGIEGLGQITIPLPPISEQEHFASVVTCHERLRAQQAEAERQAEMLFQSLLAQAFS